jgi:hypothetical protein
MTTRLPLMKRGSATDNSKRSSMRGSILNTTARRDLIAAQLALDKEIFDPSLGCPLTSFEGATLALMGGKSLNCWKLARHGFPIPTAFVIPTYVYSLHIDEADVASLINDVYTANLNDEIAHGAAKAKLAAIREKIMKTELNPEVVNNLKLFLESLAAGSFVAVRSSSSAEDLDSQSFAGQYDTCKFVSIKNYNIMFLCFSLSDSILNQSSPRLDVAHALYTLDKSHPDD